MTARMTLDQLEERLKTLAADGARRIVGITGAPGAGKSTLAEHLRTRMSAVVVPMDGYHLANSEIMRLGLSHRKGSPPTFDSLGYVSLLERLRRQSPSEVVYAPEFRREIREAVAGAIPIAASTGLVLTEGNYLLLEISPWVRIRALLDEVWYLELEGDERRRRLAARHIRFGKEEEAALRFVAESDEPNAVLIEASKPRANLVFSLN